MRTVTLAVIGAALCLPATAADAAVCGSVPNVLIVLDRSGSMTSSYGLPASRWDVAKQAVNGLTGAFSGQLGFGLAIFPNTQAGASYCTPAGINVGCGPNNAAAISSAMQGTFPSGSTPIGDSLNAARTYLVGLGTSKKSYVILITDGGESCSGSPTGAAGALKQAGINTYVIGFGSTVNPTTLQQIAQAGGTSNFYSATNPTQLKNALKTIAGSLSCCGNGKVDTGEQCDTQIPFGATGACPTTCNDNKKCTKDALSGTACNAKCTFTAITKPANNDGCCPKGATYTNDNDCARQCGNGKLDSGERCDTSITSGKGSCPKSCDDKNKCTADKLMGKDCSAYCSHTSVCAYLCGNGKVDAGERCDTKITSGKGSCPKSCNDNDACTKDVLEGKGCLARCTHVKIAANAKTKDKCCPKGLSSIQDADCLAPCTPDRTTNCVNVCKDVKCKNGEYCKLGKCVPWPKQPAAGSEKPQQPGTGGDGGAGAGKRRGNGYFVDNGAGCACHTQGGSGSTSGLGLLLLLALLRRRRRRGNDHSA